MKPHTNYGLIMVFFFLIALVAQSKENTKTSGNDVNIQYQKKQKGYQNKIQRYWYVSPDTSILIADSAILFAKNNNNKRDISYFNLLKGIAYYYQGKNSEAVNTFRYSLQIGSKTLSDKLTANAYNMLSLVYRNLGVYDSAIFYSREALQLRQEKIKDSSDIAGSYDNLSTIYLKLGEYDSAINYSLKAADIFEKTGNKRELAYSWSNLSNLYAAVGDKKHTYHFLRMAFEVLKKEGDEGDYAVMLENLGSYFLDYGPLDSAMIYFKKASVLYKKLERYDGYGDSKRAMGEIYLRLGENIKAEKEFAEAYKQFKISKRIVDLIETEVFLAEIELRKLNYTKAKQYLENAILLEKNIHSDKIRLKILKEKEKLFEQSGNQTEALTLFHQIETLKDSIDKKELDSKLEELSTKYHTEKIISENKKLLQLQEIERMKAKEMRILFFALIIMAVLIVINLLLILQKRKRNILLQKQKLDIAKKEEELIKTELQNVELKKQELSKENVYRSRQLTTYTLHMMQKNLILHDVLNKVKLMESKEPRQIKEELVNLKIQLINALSSDSDWENFKLFFEKVNANFFIRLKEKYPNISKKDEKLCALIWLNMDINEAASVLNVDYNTIRIARYRLRKKMGLNPQDDLYKIIQKV